jgi:hypothetical protein
MKLGRRIHVFAVMVSRAYRHGRNIRRIKDDSKGHICEKWGYNIIPYKWRQGFIEWGRARPYRRIIRLCCKLPSITIRGWTYGIIERRSEQLHGMTDVEGKHLSEIRENRTADGAGRVRSGPKMDEYVVAPTVEALERLGGSPMSTTAGDVAMGRREEA